MEQGIIQALSAVLSMKSVKMIAVALEGLSSILEMGAKHFLTEEGDNMFAFEMERVGGVDALESL